VSSKKLFELKLEIDSIIIGERFKGGVFRPCQDTIPSSTVEGSLRHCFGIEVYAVGFFEGGTYEFEEYTYSVKDKLLNISKMPIIAVYLKEKEGYRKIRARLYIPLDKGILIDKLQDSEFQMGALKSKGFGKSKIVEVKEIESEIKQGTLKVKLFKEEAGNFGIKEVSPIYGYLFRPDKFFLGGTYEKALFPDSIVKAPKVLLKEVTYYDEQNG